MWKLNKQEREGSRRGKITVTSVNQTLNCTDIQRKSLNSTVLIKSVSSAPMLKAFLFINKYLPGLSRRTILNITTRLKYFLRVFIKFILTLPHLHIKWILNLVFIHSHVGTISAQVHFAGIQPSTVVDLELSAAMTLALIWRMTIYEFILTITQIDRLLMAKSSKKTIINSWSNSWEINLYKLVNN